MNKVVLVGRLTKQPELRVTTSGTSVCAFTLAVDRRFKSEGQPTADFINCVAWNKIAEFITNYFNKGNKLGVAGRIQTRSWDGKDGKKNYATEVIVEEAYFIESKNTKEVNFDNQEEIQDGVFPSFDDGDIPF